MLIRRLALTIWLIAAAALAAAQHLTVQDILALPTPRADRRVSYGSGPLQFGDLRVPRAPGPHPVAIVIHGGCWRSQYDLEHLSSFCAALTREGVATWSLEYRRLGDAGGGWPGTFEDVARGADFVAELAPEHHLDVGRVVTVGHSAGGHLALWLAGRARLAGASPIRAGDPLPLRGVVALAAVTDLARAAADGVCGEAVLQLLGGAPADTADRYRQASPIALLPLGVPQRLVHGVHDRIVPLSYAADYEAAAREHGDEVRTIAIETAAHFELIAPETAAWPVVRDAVRDLLGR